MSEVYDMLKIKQHFTCVKETMRLGDLFILIKHLGIMLRYSWHTAVLYYKLLSLYCSVVLVMCAHFKKAEPSF